MELFGSADKIYCVASLISSLSGQVDRSPLIHCIENFDHLANYKLKQNVVVTTHLEKVKTVNGLF